MYMVVVIVASLVFGLPYKTMTHNQAQLYKETHCIIKCSTRYSEALFQHFFAQFFEREMPLHTVDRIENGKSFRGLSVVVHLKVAIKYAPNFFFDYVFSHDSLIKFPQS